MLLDTHVLLWLLDGSPRLGPTVRRTIADTRRVMVSSVSHAELAVKQMLGKLTLPDDFARLVRQQGLHDLPFNAEHAGGMAVFEQLVRHDPFDRMLLAQANVEGIAFCTADRRLLELGLPGIVDAAV